jgi:predicted phage tail protein
MIINLHGKLGQKYGKVHKFKVRNAKEAVDALCANFEGFKRDLKIMPQRGIIYKAITEKNNVCKEMCDYYERSEVIDIVPSIFGSAVGGLIVSAVFGQTFAASVGGLVLGAVINIGIAILVNAVIALLFAVEPLSEISQAADAQTESYLFNNNDNNAIQGFRVPLIYGQIRVGSSIISTNAKALDVSIEV